MKNKPLVSVIMNCYNGENYLKESIQSVLNQNYNNWELIFWDNKSQDKSKKFFKEFRDKRLKYYCAKKFTNLYTARNLAIKKARGEIITFLDVDDFWLSKKLTKQVSFFKKNKNAELIYSNFFNMKNFFGFSFDSLKFKQILPSGFITGQLLNSYCIAWITVAMKKSLIKKKIFNEKLDMMSDFDFIINYSLKNKIFSIQEPLAKYRLHPNQLTRKNFFLQSEQFLKWYKSHKVETKLRKFKKSKKFLNKIIFFEKIVKYKKKKTLLPDIANSFLKGEIKLALKLLIFAISPNFFIRVIASI